jgi:hypothetical protein
VSLQDELRATRDGTIPPAPLRRWDLLAAWAVILAPALGIAIWIGLRQRVGDLQERFFRDANAAFSRPLSRPVHVDRAAPGTVGEAVARDLPAVQAWLTSVRDDTKALETARAVVAGVRPLADLPPSFSAALESLSASLDGLLAGTRAGRLDLPLAPEKWEPCPGADWGGYQTAALFAGLRVRRALAAGDAGGAMATCLDGLALGRDAAISSSLVGHMVGAAIVKRLLPPCAAALAGLDPGERPAAAARLRSVRDAFPSIPEMCRVDFLGQELIVLGRVMTPGERARLAPLALAQIPSGPAPAAWERLLARDAWRSMRATWDGLLRVAEQERGLARDAGFAAVLKGTERYVNPLAAIGTPAGYARYARRAEAAVARFDFAVLSAAVVSFREREGRWPASVGELAGRELLTPGETERLAEARLVASGPLQPLELKLSVYSGEEKQPLDELCLKITPPARARPTSAR